MKKIAFLLLLLPLLHGCTTGANSALGNPVQRTHSSKPWRSFTDYDLETAQVAFSPDGKSLAAAGQNKMMVTMKEKGRTLKLEGSDYTVRIWSTSTWKLTRTLHLKDLIGDISFSPDGKLLAVTAGSTLTIYKTADGRVIRALGSQNELSSIAFSPQGNVLSVGSKLIDTRTWKALYNLPTVDSVYSVVFTPDGKTLATGSMEGVVQVWDVTTGKQKRIVHRAADFVDVVFSPNGKMLSTSCWRDEAVRLWDTSNWKQIGSLKGGETDNYGLGEKVITGVDSVAFSPDSKTLLSASGIDPAMKLWDISTGQVLHTFGGKDGTLSAYEVVFSPDGSLIASASRDTQIDLWKVPAR